MVTKQHITDFVFKTVLSYYASINKGLSPKVSSAFPDIVGKVKINLPGNLHPEWVSGFVAGEGKFYIGFKANLRMKVGYDVYLKFRITQHKRDKHLMGLIINYLGQVDLKINLV